MRRKSTRPANPADFLRKGIASIVRGGAAPASKLALPEQPFDRHLLAMSPLYRRSRKAFLDGGGQFHSALLSSPRTLSSLTLLDNWIGYSPVESELIWAATDVKQKKDDDHLLTVRTYVSSLFHEQNHRILWTMLAPCPNHRAGLRKYLNFAESLVITLDMALGDELGPEASELFYMIGCTYDPGTTVQSELKNKRRYRNYLQAALHATYLNLELYEPADIERGISALFPAESELALRAARRSSNLDRAFVWKTNPSWQKQHGAEVIKRLSRPKRAGLELPDDPMDNRPQYLFAEKLFDLMGL